MTLQHTGLGQLLDSLSGTIADWALEDLLQVMKHAFELSDDVILAPIVGLEGYSANIREFNAVYGFESKDASVQATAVFKNNKMEVKEDGPETWDMKVMFTDARAFWNFIFSGGQDIVQSILDNEVEAYGNLNHLYKFGFMARDLKERLGLG
jgi:hypothetical protein